MYILSSTIQMLTERYTDIQSVRIEEMELPNQEGISG